MAKGQKKSNREIKKPKQKKADGPAAENALGALGKRILDQNKDRKPAKK